MTKHIATIASLLLSVALTCGSAVLGQSAGLTAEEARHLTPQQAAEIAFELRDANETQEALDYALWATEEAPRNVDAWDALALVYYDMQDFDAAVEAAEAALAIDPDDILGMDVLGSSRLGQGRTAEALVLCRRIIAKDPEYFSAYFTRAGAYAKLGMHELAAADYLRVTELEPEHDVAFNNLGVALYEQEAYEDALDAYDRSLEIDPEDAGTLTNRAVALIALGREHQAFFDFKQALLIDEEVAEDFANEQLLETVAELESLGYVGPSNAPQHGGPSAPAMGGEPRDSLTDEEDLFSAAARALEEAGDMNRDFAEAHYELGVLAASAGDHEEAAGQFKMAMQADPTNVEYAAEAALANRRVGNHEDALECITTAIELEPENVELLEQRVRICGTLGRFDQAAEDARTIVTADPENAEMHNLLAWTLYRIGDNQQALKHANVSIALVSDDWDNHHTRGEIYRAMGRIDEAYDDLTVALALVSDDDEAEMVEESLAALQEQMQTQDETQMTSASDQL